MAVSVRIEDEAFADVRVEVLAELRGVNKYEALGRLAYLWRHCTQRNRHVVSALVIDTLLGDGGADALVQAELGEYVDGGIRVCGTKGRIEWLEELRSGNAAGGEARAGSAERDQHGRFAKSTVKTPAEHRGEQNHSDERQRFAAEVQNSPAEPQKHRASPAHSSAPAPVPTPVPVRKDPSTVAWEEPGPPETSTALVPSRDHHGGMTRAEVEQRVGGGVAFAPKHLRKLEELRPVLPDELEWALGVARAKDPRCGPGFVLAVLERGRREAAEQGAGTGPPRAGPAMARRDRELAVVMQTTEATGGRMFEDFKGGKR